MSLAPRRYTGKTAPGPSRHQRDGMHALSRCIRPCRAVQQAQPARQSPHDAQGHTRPSPNWTFCSFSAAVAHGLQVPRALLAPVHIAISPTESRRKKPGHVACHTDHGGSRVITDGMPCTCLLQTLLDCLCATGFRYGLAIVDSALHYHLTTHEELARHFADHGKGRRGIRQAQQTLPTQTVGAKTAGSPLSVRQSSNSGSKHPNFK